jgi:hypothetical protein
MAADFSDALPLSYPDASGAGVEPATFGLRRIRLLHHRPFSCFGRARRRVNVIGRGTNATVVLSVLAIEHPQPEGSGRESNPLPPFQGSDEVSVATTTGSSSGFGRMNRPINVDGRGTNECGELPTLCHRAFRTRTPKRESNPRPSAREVSASYTTGLFFWFWARVAG